MYEKKSVHGITKNCWCLKNDVPTQMKEISNPIPFCSILNPSSKTDIKKLKEKMRKSSKAEELHIDNKMSKSFDFIYSQSKNDALGEEITKTIKKDLVNHEQNFKNIQWKPLVNQKKKINLIYITNRIIVADDDCTDSIEYDKALRSLSICYGKYLKTFYLSVRSTVENPHKDQTNYLSSLPFLMPFLYESYYFLTNIHSWLLKSKKNIILLKGKENSYHLLEAVVRFLIITDETNERLYKPENVVLSNHETNALIFYEKLHLEKFINSSLKRYVATISSISFGILQYNSNPKQLHFIIIKNMSYTRKITSNANTSSSKMSECSNKNEKLKSVFVTVYQNFHLIYTSDKILLSQEKEANQIIFVIDPILPITGDILIMANVLNRSDLQYIYFRIQLHTCWINGSSLVFKNSELDKSRDCSSQFPDSVELLFKPNPVIVKDHENMLLSEKYSMSNQRISAVNIFEQIKILDQTIKKSKLSYQVGPLNGNIYASISNSRSIEKEQMDDFTCKRENSNVLRTFNLLENEISSAVELLTNNEKNCPKFENRMKNTKVYENDSIQTNLLEERCKESNEKVAVSKKLNQVKGFSIKPTNNCIEFNKFDDGKLEAKLKSSKNISPYDNFNIQIKLSDDLNNSFTSKEEKILPLEKVMERSLLKNVQSENKYISNLNVCKELKDSTRCSSIYSKILSVDQQLIAENDNLLYDNLPPKQSKVIIDAITTQHLWYRHYFTRQTATMYLLNKSVGHFVIRPSTSLWKSLSIALKYSTSIFNSTNSDDDNHIKHFIIDINTEGYRIRGFVNEKYYKTLPMLVQDHTENHLGLPCNLILPEKNCDDDFNVHNNFECAERYSITSDLNDFQVIYLGSFILSNTTENATIASAIDKLQEKFTHFPISLDDFPHNKLNLKFRTDRIIFTDIKKKFFLRKYCKFNDIIYCGVDPKCRVWKNIKSSDVSSKITDLHSPIFGIVSKVTSQEISDQVHCQLFATINCNSEELCAIVRKSLVKF